MPTPLNQPVAAALHAGQLVELDAEALSMTEQPFLVRRPTHSFPPVARDSLPRSRPG